MMKHSPVTLGACEFGNQTSEVCIDMARPKETTRM